MTTKVEKEVPAEMFSGKKLLKNSIIKKILVPMTILVVLQSLLLTGSIFQSGVIKKLNDNAETILHERVLNRKNYIENTMTSNWSNVENTVQSVNAIATSLLKEKQTDIDSMINDAQVDNLFLNRVSERLISMMRSNRVTGAFVVLNHADLSQDVAQGSFKSKTGVYFRDLDPNASPSFRNQDLLIERAPTAVVQTQGVATDVAWLPKFPFDSSASYPSFFYEPYQNALARPAELSLKDMGYWSAPYSLEQDSCQVISFSVPLILENGTVYGVLGIEVTLDYLNSLLPYEEIGEHKQGSYFIGIASKEDPLSFHSVTTSGPMLSQVLGDTTNVKIEAASNQKNATSVIRHEDQTLRSCVSYLNLYNSNTAFGEQKWAISGIVPDNSLFEFSTDIQRILLLCIALTFVVGIGATMLVGFLISRPIINLSKSMERINPKKVVRLKETHIKEIDQLSSSIEKLSRDVITASNKFTQIIDMASARLAGFEIDRRNDTLFTTENFFDIFGLSDIDIDTLTVSDFVAYLTSLAPFYHSAESSDTEHVFKITSKTGQEAVYIRLTINDNGVRCSGLAEDISRTITERRVIEHERDYDLLTGLKNRRAFQRKMLGLFESGEETIKTAALLMLDLDNLKQINDNYGHDCGDVYIKCAAKVFNESTPKGTVVSRISGDEFYLFFYGYNNKAEITVLLTQFSLAIGTTTAQLPNGQSCQLRVSGGVAWYPEDSMNYTELLRFSDYAMYCVKKSRKGEFGMFERALFDQEEHLLKNKSELTELIDKRAVQFSFQPIVDVHSGEIFAYEALMRANMPTLRMPQEILALAKMEHKLNQIEVITWMKALESYVAQVDAKQIAPECKIFINSIPNEMIQDGELEQMLERYSDYFAQVVIEITEEQRKEGNICEQKIQVVRSRSGGVALDDFGSGYNSDKMLLDIVPDYIKIDMSIIRGINTDKDKQMLARKVAEYAHTHHMKIIAEGVETYEEMRTSIEVGADLLQGYYLAKPDFNPPKIPQDMLAQLQKANEEIGESTCN